MEKNGLIKSKGMVERVWVGVKDFLWIEKKEIKDML